MFSHNISTKLIRFPNISLLNWFCCVRRKKCRRSAIFLNDLKHDSLMNTNCNSNMLDLHFVPAWLTIIDKSTVSFVLRDGFLKLNFYSLEIVTSFVHRLIRHHAIRAIHGNSTEILWFETCFRNDVFAMINTHTGSRTNVKISGEEAITKNKRWIYERYSFMLQRNEDRAYSNCNWCSAKIHASNHWERWWTDGRVKSVQHWEVGESYGFCRYYFVGNIVFNRFYA